MAFDIAESPDSRIFPLRLDFWHWKYSDGKNPAASGMAAGFLTSCDGAVQAGRQMPCILWKIYVKA